MNRIINFFKNPDQSRRPINERDPAGQHSRRGLLTGL